MSLSNIKLPNIVIADLFRQSLIQYDGVVPNDAPATPGETKAITSPKPLESTLQAATSEPAIAQRIIYKTLGNNKQNITIVVNFAHEVFLPEADLQFLTKMLTACKLNLADVSIVNHAAAPIAIEPLKEQLRPKHILLFGVEPAVIQLPISFPAFKEQNYAGCTYLFTPSLNQLNQENEEAKQLKRKLWDCLKRIFL